MLRTIVLLAGLGTALIAGGLLVARSEAMVNALHTPWVESHDQDVTAGQVYRLEGCFTVTGPGLVFAALRVVWYTESGVGLALADAPGDPALIGVEQCIVLTNAVAPCEASLARYGLAASEDPALVHIPNPIQLSLEPGATPIPCPTPTPTPTPTSTPAPAPTPTPTSRPTAPPEPPEPTAAPEPTAPPPPPTTSAPPTGPEPAPAVASAIYPNDVPLDETAARPTDDASGSAQGTQDATQDGQDAVQVDAQQATPDHVTLIVQAEPKPLGNVSREREQRALADGEGHPLWLLAIAFGMIAVGLPLTVGGAWRRARRGDKRRGRS